MTLMHRTTLMAYMVSALKLARPADMILDVSNIDRSSVDDAAFSRGLSSADCMLKSGCVLQGPLWQSRCQATQISYLTASE